MRKKHLILITLVFIVWLIAFSLKGASNVYSQACSDNPVDPVVSNSLVSTKALPFDLPVLNSNCLIDPARSSVPSLSIPTYNYLLAYYYTKSSAVKTDLSGDQIYSSANQVISLSSGGLYHILGNLTFSDELSSPSKGVIFVDGNLLIKTSSGDFNPGNATSGVIFVVQGNVYIDSAVGGVGKSVDAFFVTHGVFCSASTGDLPATTCSNSSLPLTINGSIISLGATNPPSFTRAYPPNTNPAETINFQPKYLVILRSLFSSDARYWSEI